MTFELFIVHGGAVQLPVLKDSICWESARKGAPGKLEFTCVKAPGLDFQEGDAVRLTVDNTPVFYGFVFTKSRGKEHQIKVTAYDQLRYFKNKETLVYEDKTASALLQMLAQDFRLQTGALADTGFKIAWRLEENKTLFDIVQNALDLTLCNTGRLYVLYDDCGKLTLRDMEEMRLPLLLTEQTAQDFTYTSSIDKETYNAVKLVYKNDQTGKLETWVAQNGAHQNEWGVLQYCESTDGPDGGQAKADALLALYDRKTRNLTVKGVPGDVRVRAGSSLVVKLGLGDLDTCNYMLVENVKHKLSQGVYTMDLTVVGGEFIA